MKRKLLALFVLLSSLTYAQVPSYVPQSGLRCYYPFSGNPNDASAAASHLVNSGAVLTTDRFANPNSAYSFNGTNQSMSKTNPNFTFSSAGSFTVSVWIQKTTTAGGVALINGTSTAGNFIWLLQGGTTMTYGTNKQQQSWVYVSSPITIGSWEHFVCVYNNGAMTFYRNNVVEGTGTFTYTGVTSANMPFYVGKGISGGYFAGNIDDLGIWDRALSTCEINDLFNATSTITTVNAGPDVSLCAGNSTTLTGSGATTLQWNPIVTNGVSFTPTSTQTYTLTGTDANGCSAWDQVEVTVNQPLINGGPNQTICLGSSITLTAAGTNSATWDNGVLNGVPFIPTSSQTYTVTGIDLNGCPGTDQVLINTYQPNINAGSNVAVCAGESVTLTGSGGVTYVWDNGVSNGVSFVPNASQTYILVGTDGFGCSKTDSVDVVVNATPNIQAGVDIAVCDGDNVTLSGSGGVSYVWNNGVTDGSTFTPTVSNTYIVTGTDNNNCTNVDSVFVAVNQPTVSNLNISAIDQYVLNGTTYSTSGTYTQVITNANGCDSTITLNLFLDFTGLEEVSKTLVRFYPNPVNDFVYISADVSVIGKTIQVFALDGKLVKTIVLSQEQSEINFSELSSGVYTCRMDDMSEFNFRLVKY